MHPCDGLFIKAVTALQLTSPSLRAGCVVIKGASKIIVSGCSCVVSPTVAILASIFIVCQ